MSSPFPGMDPYLEDPALWPDVLARLISVSAELLLPTLRPDYFVQIEERVYVTTFDDPGGQVYVPDLAIAPVTKFPRGIGGSTAIAIDDAVEIAQAWEPIRKERYLAVKDRHSQDVITVIEILSPANKVPGSQSRASYLEKRQDFVESSTHFVEIDLLRGGERLPWLNGPYRFDYVAHATTVAGRPLGRMWPMRLEQRLKVIGIPLQDGEAPVPLDLQQVLNTAYERAGYDLIVDYSQPPVPPLSEAQRAWANEVLRQESDLG